MNNRLIAFGDCKMVFFLLFQNKPTTFNKIEQGRKKKTKKQNQNIKQK